MYYNNIDYGRDACGDKNVTTYIPIQVNARLDDHSMHACRKRLLQEMNEP